MALFGLFSSESSVVTNQTDIKNTDSFNNTFNSPHVASNNGNITLSFGQEGAAEKAVPILIVLALSFGAYLILTRK